MLSWVNIEVGVWRDECRGKEAKSQGDCQVCVRIADCQRDIPGVYHSGN